jgi:hypothetical protein
MDGFSRSVECRAAPLAKQPEIGNYPQCFKQNGSAGILLLRKNTNPDKSLGLYFAEKAQFALIFAWGDEVNQPQLLLGATPLSAGLTA